MNASTLRVWHWRKVLYHRNVAEVAASCAEQWEAQHGGRCSSQRSRAKNNNRNANFHLGAVQVLNDHPECMGSTAEQDDALMPKPHSTVRRR